MWKNAFTYFFLAIQFVAIGILPLPVMAEESIGCVDSSGFCEDGLTSKCPAGYKWAAQPLSGCALTQKCCVPNVSCLSIKGAECVPGVLCASGFESAPGLPGTGGCSIGKKCCVPEGKITIDAQGQAFNQDASKNATAKENARKAFVNGLCFLSSECSEVGGNFEQSADCGSDQGKCIAPEPTIRLSSSVMGRATASGIRDYISIAMSFLMVAGMMAAVIMFVYAGFQYIVASSFVSVGNAKETMINASVGLLILFGAVTILNATNPSLTVFQRVKVYMINKQRFMRGEWCSEFKSPSGQKEIKYAEAGDPAGTIKYTNAKFEVKVKETKCGTTYYPEQYGGTFCQGRKCEKSGFACVSCKGNFPDCNGNRLGQACIKAAMAGVISWTDFSAPTDVRLLAVCGGAQPPVSLDNVKENTPAVVKGVLVNQTKELKGSAGFMFTSDLEEYKKAQEACDGKFRGFVMGVQYLDSCDSGVAKMKKRALQVRGAMLFQVPGFVAGTIAGEASCATNPNDVLIVSKQDCANGGSRYFSGYANGENTSSLNTDMSKALFCGWRNLPGVDKRSQPTSRDTHVFDYNSDPNLNPYWSMEDIKNAAEGKTDPILCDFGFNAENAGPDPEERYYKGCQ
ncbi:hypothetical protein IT408_00450 [Candidatus Uhrbacteria bacterium]|nr:hypothetical protein [Candidatus Uhrbacteria bacterium]